MGILDTVGEIVGPIAAVEATEKVDPDASLLTKGIAAVAGFKGAGGVTKIETPPIPCARYATALS